MAGESGPLHRSKDARPLASRQGRRLGGSVGPPLVLLTFFVGYLGLDLATEGLKGTLGVSLWFPPAGLALVLPMIFGWRYAPAVGVAFLAHMLLFRDGAGYAPWLLIAVPVLYAALYAGAAELLVRHLRIDPRLTGMRDVAWFVGVACLAVPLVVATAVVSGFVVGGYLPPSGFWGNLLGFWAGDATGVAVLGSFLLVALRPVRALWVGRYDRPSVEKVEGFRLPARRELPEVALQALVLVLSLALAFGIARDAALDYAYLVFAPVVWISLRGGFERAVAALMIVNVGVVCLVALTLGGNSPVLLQFVLTAITLVGLLFGAMATERKAAEAELVSSERRLRSVLDNSSEVVKIIDPDGTLRYASSAMKRILGYDPEEMLGTNVLEYVHPEDLPHVKSKTEEALSQSGGVPRNEAEYRFLHKDGSWRDVEATGSYLVDDPVVGGIIVISRDVTERKQAERSVRESHELLQAVLEGIDDAVYVKDASGRYLMINRAGAGLIGKDPDGVIGEDDIALFDPDDARRMQKQDREILGSGETRTFEETMKIGGGVRTYLTTKGAFHDERDHPVGVFGVSRDVTKRKRAEEELKESEARYRALMEQSVETIYVYDAETKRVLESNGAFQEMIGYTAQELVGMEIYDFIAHEREDIDRRIARSLEVGGRQLGERDYRRKDGSLVVVQTSSSVMPYGGKTAICAVSRDVTELMEARAELERSERRFRSMIQNAPDAVSVLDADSTILYDSPAIERLLGYAPEERIGQKGLDYIHPEDREAARNTLLEVLGSPGVSLPVEYRLKHKDGSWRQFEAARTNLLSDPAVGGIVLNYRDITARKRAEEELRLSEGRHRRRAWELVLLHRVRSAISAETDLQRTLKEIVEAVAETYGYTLVSSYLLEGAELIMQHQVGYDSVLERIPLHRGVMARVARTGEPVLLEDAHSDPDFLEAMPGIVSEVCVPLVVEGEVVGTLNIESTEGEELTADDLRLVEEVGDYMGGAVARAKLHERIRETERRYRTLVETIPAITYIEDFETGATLYDSPQIEQILGYPKDTYLKDPFYWFEIIHPEDKRRMQEEEERSAKSGRFIMEYRVRARDGRQVWIRDEATVVRDAAGKPIHWQGVLFDVTARKATEERLRETEIRYRSIVEQVPAVTYVEEVGQPNVLSYVSPQVEWLLGYTPYEYGGNPDLWAEVVHPDDRERYALADRQADVSEETFSLEYRMVRKDGRTIWVRDEATPLRGEDGGVHHWQGVLLDITERKEAEERLQEAELRYRNIVEQVPAITYVFSQEPGGQSAPRYISPQVEEILGYTPEEYIADPGLWQEIVYADDRERVLGADARTGETGATFREEFRMTTRNGRVTWFREEGRLARVERDGTQLWHGVMYDITELKKVEQELRRSEGRLRAIAAGAPVILFAVDRDGGFIFEGGAGLDELGLEADAGEGRSVFEAYSAFPRMLANVRRALSGEELTDTVEIAGRAYHATYSPLLDDDGEVYGVVGVAADVTERQRLEEELAHRALHDPLTGLPNRRLLLERLSQGPGSRRRHAVALLFLDLDGFKAVNDSLGHDMGDALLVAAGERLSEVLRPQDTVARMGGDEFCVVLEDAGRDEAVRIADRIVQRLAAPFKVRDLSEGGEEGEIRVSASVGIALGNGRERAVTGLAAEGAELLREADVAMYRAKEAGKGSYIVYEPHMDDVAVARLGLRVELARALERGELVLRYQPVFSLESGEIVGLEALIRWEHPRKGELAPADFLAEAEDAGLAEDIAELTLNEACRFVASLGDAVDAASPDDLPWVSINLSPRRLEKPGLPEAVARALEVSGTDPRSLVLEITEDAAAEGLAARMAVLALKELGVGIALDDFGTGHSSLSQLEQLPVDILKLDRAFVANLVEDGRKPAMIRGVMGIARALDLAVVAEGVETEVQRSVLREADCDFAQGRVFSMPLSAVETISLLQKGSPSRTDPRG